MPKVVVRGESVYQCDVCSRSIRVPTIKQGMDVLQRCIITYGCQGKLYRVTQAKQINETPAFPPEVEGVQDWFQRRVLYTHLQPVQAATWVIKHNLASRPVIHVYVNRIVDGEEQLVTFRPTTITTVDLNTIELTFDVAESGLVQCIALASQNATNPLSTAPTAASTVATQITSNTGELTLATLNSDPLVGLGLTYLTSGALANVTIEYAGIDAAPSVESPWVGSQIAVINGKKYTIRSFNLTTTPLAPSYFGAGAVPNGSAFYVSSYNGAPPTTGEVLILLGRAPYASVDRITDSYIDLSHISTTAPELFYTTGVGYAQPSVIRSTYPPILVV